jgi:TfoX/Sxy family transcriptional regulator of competence genes
MGFPRPISEAQALFEAALPKDARVSRRAMFGNVAAFANGQMFTGVFGAQVFVRLPDKQRGLLLKEQGAGPFAPMAGREMREYAVLPPGWAERPERARVRMERALAYVVSMPGKTAKAAPPKRRTGSA